MSNLFYGHCNNNINHNNTTININNNEGCSFSVPVYNPTPGESVSNSAAITKSKQKYDTNNNAVTPGYIVQASDSTETCKYMDLDDLFGAHEPATPGKDIEDDETTPPPRRGFRKQKISIAKLIGKKCFNCHQHLSFTQIDCIRCGHNNGQAGFEPIPDGIT